MWQLYVMQKLAGVSVATVSRVINEKGYVHEDTVKQVKEAIEELRYRPNSAAKPLFKREFNDNCITCR